LQKAASGGPAELDIDELNDERGGPPGLPDKTLFQWQSHFPEIFERPMVAAPADDAGIFLTSWNVSVADAARSAARQDGNYWQPLMVAAFPLDAVDDPPLSTAG
jgi:hypothetical protein